MNRAHEVDRQARDRVEKPAEIPFPKIMRSRRKFAIWDQKFIGVLTTLTPDILRKSIELGSVIRRCRICETGREAKQKCLGIVRPHVMVFAATDIFRLNVESSASITAEEIRANAGIGTPAQVRSAQEKVKAFRSEGDYASPLPTKNPKSLERRKRKVLRQLSGDWKAPQPGERRVRRKKRGALVPNA